MCLHITIIFSGFLKEKKYFIGCLLWLYFFYQNIPNSNWNLQFLNNVIINKTKVLFPRAWVILADFDHPVWAMWFYCSQNFKLFGFPIFWFWASPNESYFQKRIVCTKFDIYVFINCCNIILIYYHCTF